MGDKIARKGDSDDLGYFVDSDCSTTVTIDGKPVALKGSKMNDGAAIIEDCSTTIMIEGQFVALKGSKTEYHEHNPKGIGTIIEGSDTSEG